MKNSPPPRLAPDEELFTERPVTAFARGPARRPEAPYEPPRTVEEAEARYWRRYSWQLVEALLGSVDRPETIDEWHDLAVRTRDELTRSPRERLARHLEDLAAALRRKDRGDA
jgi:hypothetical protein